MLVFVSACHSEDVGRAFQSLGVPYVRRTRRMPPCSFLRCGRVRVPACAAACVRRSASGRAAAQVIAVESASEILDDASIKFAHHLYTSLLRGLAVQESYDIALQVRWVIGVG